jgi:serine/threonine protein kinase
MINRWNAIEETFHAALAKDEPERTRFLVEDCVQDTEVRNEVIALLAYESQAESFLEMPALGNRLSSRRVARPCLEIPSGRMIQQYRVLEKLGEGGMGVVYRAEDTRLGRFVAIKFLRGGYYDALSLEALRREARLASGLDHRRICNVFDVGEFEGLPFLVMQLLHGRPLAEVIDGRPLPLERILRIGKHLAEALEAAHAAGIVHRDFKPTNVFIVDRDEAKVLDFGLARSTSADEDWWASQGRSEDDAEDLPVAGTPAYMAPEQLLGEAEDNRSDLYSCGAVLYEMATGRPAFGGETLGEVFDAVLHQRPIPPCQLNRNLPRPLQKLILKALAKAPSQRYQSAGELRADLDQLRHRFSLAPHRKKPVMDVHWGSRSTISLLCIGVAIGSALATLICKGRHTK